MTAENFVRVGVAVVVRRRGRLLMGPRRGSHGAGTWSVPGGSLQPGETVYECAARELLEETGMVVDLSYVSIWGVTARVYDTGEGRHFTTVYVLAPVSLDQDPTVREPDKCERWEWLRESPGPLFLPLANFLDQQGFRCIADLAFDPDPQYP